MHVPAFGVSSLLKDKFFLSLSLHLMFCNSYVIALHVFAHFSECLAFLPCICISCFITLLRYDFFPTLIALDPLHKLQLCVHVTAQDVFSGKMVLSVCLSVCLFSIPCTITIRKTVTIPRMVTIPWMVTIPKTVAVP